MEDVLVVVAVPGPTSLNADLLEAALKALTNPGHCMEVLGQEGKGSRQCSMDQTFF